MPGRASRTVVVGLQVDLLVLERAPEPLDEDVVEAAALAVHADLRCLGRASTRR